MRSASHSVSHAVTLSVRSEREHVSLSGLPTGRDTGRGTAIGRATATAGVASGNAGNATATDGVATFEDGRIETIEFLGEFERYSVRVGRALVTADVGHHRGREPLAAGTPVRIEVRAREIRLMAAT